ncbi:hypothetical protein GCM10023091_18610 [Ravibacter arvi]|uniref:Lipoprotein n=1 Tax=Ravibacter arvi TaxID=2051041 RepID=A0ABP8LXM7_9BACT
MNRFSSSRIALSVVLCVFFLACKDTKKQDPDQEFNGTEIVTHNKDVSQSELVQLVASGEHFGNAVIEADLGGIKLKLFASGDTLSFVVPDVSPGVHALSFRAGEKAYRAKYSIRTTVVSDINVPIAAFKKGITAHIEFLEQHLRISTVPSNNVVNAQEIAALKVLLEKFQMDVAAATEAERKALARFLQANSSAMAFGENFRKGREGELLNGFLAAAEAIVSKEGAKAVFLGALGRILMTGGALGVLVGAAVLVYAAVILKVAWSKIMDLSQVNAARTGAVGQIFANRVAAREVYREKPYRIVVGSTYRTIGKEDAGDPRLVRLFDLNDKIVAIAKVLKQLKVFSGDVFNLREVTGREKTITVPAQSITAVISDNSAVMFKRSEVAADTLVLTFESSSDKDESFTLKYSFKDEENESVSVTELFVLKAKAVDSLEITPAKVGNYRLLGKDSEKISFRLVGEPSGAEWSVPYFTRQNGHIERYGSISDDGVYTVNELSQVIGEVRVMAKAGSRTGIARIDITACVLEIMVSSFAPIWNQNIDYESVVKGNGIGKLIELKWGDRTFYTLKYEYAPQFGENSLLLSNPFNVPIGVDFYKMPSNSSGVPARTEITGKATEKITYELHPLRYP